MFAFAGRPRIAFEIIWVCGPAPTGGLADYFLVFWMFSPFCLKASGIFKSICYFGMLKVYKKVFGVWVGRCGEGVKLEYQIKPKENFFINQNYPKNYPTVH